MKHLTVLVAWHDSGWNGKICRNPKENKFCEVPTWIKRGKYGYYNIIESGKTKSKKIPKSDCEFNKGQSFSEAMKNKWYVCPFEIRMFDSKDNLLIYWLVGKRFKIKNNKNNFKFVSNLIDNLECFYKSHESLCFIHCNNSPFENKIICACIKPKEKVIKLRTDESCEDGIKSNSIEVKFDEIIEKVRNREDLVKEEIDEITRLMKKREYFTIEIRYDPKDVLFIIPYQELAEYYRGYDKIPDKLILEVPQEALKSFYNNFLSNELAIFILERALKIIEEINKELRKNPRLEDYLKMFREKFMNISEFPDRIKKCIGQLRRLKFKYPGLPSVLRYLGVEDAVSIYIDAIERGKEEEMYQAVKNALVNNEECLEYRITRRILNVYNGKSKEIRRFLIDYLPYYDLTKSDIEELFKQKDKKYIDIKKVLDNPYLLYEDLRMKEDFGIAFQEIDGWEANRLGNQFDIIDKRRIRALLVAMLRRALNDGHTVVPYCKGLQSVKYDLEYYFRQINDSLPEDRRIDFERLLELIFENSDKDFVDFIREKINIDETEFEDELGRKYKIKLFSLKEIKDKEGFVKSFIEKMTERNYEIKANDDELKSLLRGEKPEGIPKNEYEKALDNQVEALKTIIKNGCSILTGSAGTGKTHVIKALLEYLCKYENPRKIVVLAPTGKASVRIRETISNVLENYRKIIEEPKTIHRFLVENYEFDFDYMLFKEPKKKVQVDALIVDEASMIGLELLYYLLNCVNLSKRIVFVGDVNQLPPIEAGKPFFDLYTYLKRKEKDENKKYIAELGICLRAESKRIFEFSKLYERPKSGEKVENKIKNKEEIVEKLIDEVYKSKCKVNNDLIKYCLKDDNGIERIVIFECNDLYKALERAIDYLIEVNNGNPNNYRDFFKLFVFEDKIQILAPTRVKGKLGSHIINYWIRDDSKYTDNVRDVFTRFNFACNYYKKKDFADKVIQTVNNWKLDVYDYVKGIELPEYGVFNGMMGYVESVNSIDRNEKRKDKVIKFYFPKVQAYIEITKGTKKLFKRFGRKIENKVLNNEELEYAYAITIHKAQGCEFDNVIFVFPSGLSVSRELLYTAITRARSRLVIVTDNLGCLFDFNRSSELSKRYSNLFKNPIDPRAYPEHLRIITVRGEIVRSWQECTIANLFYYENIDYEYEPKIWISNIPLISDFRLKSEYEKEIIWEHLGMDKNHYEDRLRLYEQSGFNIIEIKDVDEKNS